MLDSAPTPRASRVRRAMRAKKKWRVFLVSPSVRLKKRIFFFEFFEIFGISRRYT